MRNEKQLYRNMKTGQVVELVSEPTCAAGEMAYRPRGRRFVEVLSTSSFNAAFSPLGEPRLRLSKVYFEGCDLADAIPAYLGQERWNGYERPYFPDSSMEQVLRLCDGVTRDVESGHYRMADLNEPTETWIEEPQVVLTETGQRISAYGIGVGSWCWVEAIDQSEVAMPEEPAAMPEYFAEPGEFAVPWDFARVRNMRRVLRRLLDTAVPASSAAGSIFARLEASDLYASMFSIEEEQQVVDHVRRLQRDAVPGSYLYGRRPIATFDEALHLCGRSAIDAALGSER